MNDLIKRKRKLPSLVRWVIWALLVQFILLNISSAIYAYRLTHFYNQPGTKDKLGGGNIFERTWKLFTGPRQVKAVIRDRPSFTYKDVRFKTAKGLDIDAWYAPVDSVSKGTIILFHGITVNKSTLLEEAYEFRYWGYDLLLVDLRGHGGSEGNTTTIGFRESEEVQLAYDFISKKNRGKIYLYGVSLGAVVVAKGVADHALQPAGIILDMPFSSLQSYLENKARTLGFPSQPFAFLTTFWIGVGHGFNGYGHKTSSYLKKIECPVLMQWGSRDPFILKGETDRIYNAIASTQKKLVIYEHAGHESFLNNDPVKWRLNVEEFLTDK